MTKKNQGLVFLALSQYQADRLLQNGYPSEAVTVLPPFTDLPVLDALPGEYLNSNTLLFTGRVVPQKGLDALLKSLRHLTAPFHLIVDGDGHALDKARVVARELGLESRVEFAGWAPREKHLGYYRQASVVVVPSVWPEPFGLVGIEAMSFGKPVVAFRVGGIPEWLEDGVTGFLVKPYDLIEMAKRIDYLLAHPDFACAMGKRGRLRVEQDFNKDRHISKLLDIYKQVVDYRFRFEAPAHKHAVVQTPVQAV